MRPAARRMPRGTRLSGRGIGAAAPVSASGPSRRYDVVIVGAGAAGLAAGRDLTRAGLRVAVVEARERLGGRVHTIAPAGWTVPVELGGEFVHGRSRPVFELAGRAGAAPLRIPYAHVDGAGRRLRWMPDVWARFERIVSKLPARGRDVSVAEFLAGPRGRRLSSDDRRLLVSMVEGYDAAPVASASVHALSSAGETAAGDRDRAQFRTAGGYGALVAALAAEMQPDRADVFTSTPVSRIRWKSGRVEATTPLGTVRARQALVTVPVGVLRAPEGARGAIAFEPDPPEMRRALEGLAMGHAVKLLLRFDRALWLDSPRLAALARSRPDTPPSFFHLGTDSFPTWWTAAPFDAPVLTAWSGGPRAEALRHRDERAILRIALAELSEGLDLPVRRLRSALRDRRRHDWSADPFSRGAYSYAAVGGADAGRRLARPIADTLFFAGEASSTEESGTVGAALASGRAAARRILRRR